MEDIAREANSEWDLFGDFLAAVREVNQTASDIYGQWVEPTEAPAQKQESAPAQAPADENNTVLESSKTGGIDQGMLILGVGVVALFLALK